MNAAADAVLSGRGKEVMDEVRKVIVEMEDEENERLKQRSQLAEAVARNTIATIMIGTLLAFVLVSAAGFLVTRSVTSQVRYSVNVLASSAS
jgi:CHASE3 domain sensor protein